MSQELKAFYQAILAWIEAGLPEHDYFNKQAGLCHNLSAFLVDWNNQNNGGDNYLRASLVSSMASEMRNQFRQAELDILFPFNDGKESFYYRDVDNGATYRNPQRLAWIKEHAA